MSNTISANSTINLGNTYYKTNNSNIKNKNSKEVTTYYLKKNNQQIKKSIETFKSFLERKNKLLNKEKNIKKETDSFQSTQVSLNKKTKKNPNYALSCIEQIFTQIKKTFKNKYSNSLSSFSKYDNIALNKINEFKEKISSYEYKPSPDCYKKNICSMKLSLKKRRTSTLIKNKKIFNFFSSKEIYNLRNSNDLKNPKNTNTFTINHINKIKRSINRSTNKNNEKFKVNNCINTIDSNSFLLKTFNKENIVNNFEIQKRNNPKKFKFNNNIDCGKSDNYGYFNKKHKKNKTMNISKNIEEIQNKKENNKNQKKSKITILNCINNKNLKLKLKNLSKY